MKPIGNYVLIEPIELPDTTPSGLLIPESSKEKPNQGRVVSVGDGMYNDRAERIPLTVKVDDTVLFPKYVGTELKIGGKKFLIMRESDLFGIL